MANKIKRRAGESVAPCSLQQRWLTPDGKAFLCKIIKGLRNNPTKGLDFGNITLENGKKFSDFCCVNQFSERSYRDLRFADLSRQELSGANLQNANLDNANLQGTELIGTNFQSATLKKTNLQNASLEDANLQGATLTKAILQDARLMRANLQNAWLVGANLRGTDLSGAIVAGQSILKDNSDEKDIISRTDNRSADFTGVKYSLEWRGPLWAAFLATLIVSPLLYLFRGIMRIWKWERPFWKAFEWKKFAWERQSSTNIIKKIIAKTTPEKLYKRLRKTREKIFGFCRKLCKQGRPTKFVGIDTSLMDASRNPGLKRDIEDEQFIADFHEKHPFMYWLWARSSNCGRCLSLLGNVVIFVRIGICNHIYNLSRNIYRQRTYPHAGQKLLDVFVF